MAFSQAEREKLFDQIESGDSYEEHNLLNLKPNPNYKPNQKPNEKPTNQ